MARKKKLKLMPLGKLSAAADCLKVMSHPVRLRIVNILMQGEFAVREIAEHCETSPNQTCEHLRLLRGQDLLSSERRGRSDGHHQHRGRGGGGTRFRKREGRRREEPPVEQAARGRRQPDGHGPSRAEAEL